MIGLLNLQADDDSYKTIYTHLQRSGLLQATDRIYYSRRAIVHPRAIQVNSDAELYTQAKQVPNALVWSLNTSQFRPGNTAFNDWLLYQLFFLVDHWRTAVDRLQNGYDAYGVNLHSAPEPHFEGYCFWMTATAMQKPHITNAYCAFQSFTNHHLQPFPASNYADADLNDTAPFSCQRLRARLQTLGLGESSGQLISLLCYTRDHFDPHPSRVSQRPYIISDVNDANTLALLACGHGRLDVIDASPELIAAWRSLGWKGDFNSTLTVQQPADLIYTTPVNVERWLSVLTDRGVMLVEGEYTGQLPKQSCGRFTIIARTADCFALQ